MTEFELIAHYFQPHAGQRADVVLGIGDDCALVRPAPGQLLAISTDTLNEGVHFPTGASPQALGHKALAVSLSDLAAMGAEPAWVLLSLSLPKVDKTWLAGFCEGFAQLRKSFQLQLIGGNTSRGPLAITSQVIGFVPPGQELSRSGARVGDKIYVTGWPGEAGLALAVLQNKLSLTQEHLQQAQDRLDYPTPQVAIGLALRGIASAAIDISDGLGADLEHILENSGVGATIQIASLPVSSLMQTLNSTTAHQLILTAGDDYELCFTVPPAQEPQLKQALAPLNCHYSCIGVIESAPGLRVTYADGRDFTLLKKGYYHFGEN